ncbi:MAG: uracil-DNA glycosylase [Pseudomonadota bacterium]
MTQDTNTPAAAAALSDDGARALLRWYVEMGCDVAIGNVPVDAYQFIPKAPTGPSPPSVSGDEGAPAPLLGDAGTPQARPQKRRADAPASPPTTAVLRPDANAPTADEAVVIANAVAAQADSIEALEAAVMAFDGCPLKRGARKTVFGAGVPGARLLVLGEAPGQEEDRTGVPFVGRAGHLLDRMLAAIGHSRDKDAYISNVIYWRPPGNRTPSDMEMAICRPFVERLIALSNPAILMVAGGTSLKAVLGKTGIMKTRGRWQTLSLPGADGQPREIPVMPTFHPAYLLRNPEAKRLVWQDLQMIRARLSAES